MIKQAELNAAYQQGRYAAMVKLATEKSTLDNVMENQGKLLGNIGLGGQGLSRNDQLIAGSFDPLAAGASEAAQKERAAEIATLLATDKGTSAYNPMNYATLENMSRAGMLGGAGAGAYLGGMDPRAAALASAGALGGGYAGGNVGQGIGAAINAWRGKETAANKHLSDDAMRALMASGGALGGLGGGAAAGYYGG